jgi:hypothetical protein
VAKSPKARLQEVSSYQDYYYENNFIFRISAVPRKSEQSTVTA